MNPHYTTMKILSQSQARLHLSALMFTYHQEDEINRGQKFISKYRNRLEYSHFPYMVIQHISDYSAVGLLSLLVSSPASQHSQQLHCALVSPH